MLVSPPETSVNTAFTPLLDADLLEAMSLNTTKPPDLFEDWSSFSLEMKTDLVMVEVLMQALRLSQQQALIQLKINKQNFNKLLNVKDTSALETLWKDFFSNLFPKQRHQMSVVFSIKKFILANPLKDYEEILTEAKSLFRQKPLPTIFIKEAYLYQLREILNNWLDWRKAQQQELGPLACLKVVLAHYQCPFPIDFFRQAFDRDRFPHMRFLHESALLFWQLHHADMFDRLENNATLSLHFLEDRYLSMLAEDWHKQKIFDQLFSKESVANNSQAIYFNGLALKQAVGKSFADLINNETFEINKVMNTEQRRQLVKEKFKQIGESIQYEIGSLAHSLASVVNRILYYQYLPLHGPFQSIEELVSVFKEIEEKWLLEKNYPLQPRLLLAYHLAESNNVTIEGENWQEKVKNLLTYLSKEFEKLLLKPPQFDRLRASVKILQDMGMSREQLVKKRYYVIEADDFNLSRSYFGSALEEFLKLADWDGLVGKRMYFKGKDIAPREALQAAEEAFNINLYQAHWVQNKAKSNLNKSMAAANDTDIEQEAKRIAANYATETEKHRAWMRGLETWVSTIPIIGPLYTIEEGIRDKDPVEIITGVFFLSLDAFDLLFGSEAAEKMSGSVERLRSLPIRERMVVDNVDSVFKKLDLPITELSLDESYLRHSDALSLENNSVPDAQRSLADRVRAGEKGIKWNEHELVYLSDEDRVVPVKSQGGSFREINWRSGEVAAEKHLIFSDSETGKYYATAGLKGGSPIVELEEALLKERETIKNIELLFEQAEDFLRYDFNLLFNQCFFIVKVPGVSAFNAFEFYHLLYSNSPTFRRIFNLYHANMMAEEEKAIWQISIYEKAVSHTDFKEYLIHIAPDTDISNLGYVSNSNLELSRPEQIYLHEILHALTGQFDPVKAISSRHRGSIVYLSDKILSEAGYIFPQRIMYRRLTDFSEIGEETLENINALVIQENTYLDKLLDDKVPLSEYNRVFGEVLDERYTLKELHTLWEKEKINKPVLKIDTSSILSFHQQYELLFQATNHATQLALVEFYFEIYRHSTTFAKLFDNWYMRIKAYVLQPWTFALDGEVVLSELPSNKKVHCINELTRKIYIFDDGTLYLSNKGLLPVEKKRQLLHEMVQILTDLLDMPQSLALKNRGAVVQLTDKIFAEVNFGMPKRLVYRLALSDDFAAQSVLKRNQLEASRAALLEDRVIEKKLATLPATCLPHCRRATSLRKRDIVQLAAETDGKLFNKQIEGIEAVKGDIKTHLKKYGIMQGLKSMDSASFSLNATPAVSLFFTRNLTSSRMLSPLNETFFSLNYSQ